MTGEFLTVKEVADYLQVSVSAVYSLIECGKLVVHRIGKGRGTIRVSKEDLSSFLQSCRVMSSMPQQTAKPRSKKLRHIRL